MSSLASAKMLSLVICAAVGSVMAGVSQCGTVKSVRYPWIYLGDFNEWLVRADLIVSGTIASTVRRKTPTPGRLWQRLSPAVVQWRSSE